MKLLRTALAAALAAAASLAHALTIVPYNADTVAKAMKQGAPVVLHFRADWCPTCRVQDKVLQQLKAEPGLDVTVFDVNYDKSAELKKQLGVEVQSTFIAYHGNTERTRSAGKIEAGEIKSVLQAALR